MEQAQQLRVIRPRDAQRKVGLSKTQTYELEKQGRFPRRVRLSPRASGYIEAEVDAWIRARMEERQMGAPVAPPDCDTSPVPATTPAPATRQAAARSRSARTQA